MSSLLGYYQRRPETVYAVLHEGVNRETIAGLHQLDAQFEVVPHERGNLELVDRGCSQLVRPGHWIVWGGVDRRVRLLSQQEFRRYYVPA